MLQVQMPVSYLEWGICLLTFWFCWWKYGWNMDVMKGFRQMYKKFETILVTPQPSYSEPIDTRDVKHYKKIPVTGIQFKTRSKQKPETKTSQTPFFFKTLEQNVEGKDPNNNVSPCLVCTHPNKEKVFEEIKKSVPLKNCLDCENQDPGNPWYIRKFGYFLFFWKKWNIGGQYHMVSLKDMMLDERLNRAVEEAARQEHEDNPNSGSLESLIKKHKRRAEAITIRMRAKQPKHPWFALYVRIASWIIAKALGRIYPKILVRQSQIDEIHKARDSGHPILYLPIHRSHIDYVLVSWALVACDTRSPLVAAGGNLNIPVFSLMMKSVGGFFIKRKLDEKNGKRDVVYRTMLKSYMTKSLIDDNDMEFFIEGGRTRTGKPCLPKGGLLSIVVDTLMTNKVKDILVVPMNFSYDRLLEGNYVREQLGQPKINESFASAASGLWNSLQTKYGNARVDFGHPFSMKEFIQAYQMSRSPSILSIGNSDSGHENENEKTPLNRTSSNVSSCSSLCTTEFKISTDDQRALVDNLARHVIYDGVKCFTLMSTNAVAFLLLNKYRDGVSIEMLKKDILELKKDMLERGHDSGFSDEMDEVVNYGVNILGPTLIHQDNNKHDELSVEGQTYVKPITDLPNVIELSYYSNCVLPIYAVEAVIATSVFVLAGESINSEKEIRLKKQDLITTCRQCCEVLHHEFLFSPSCQSLTETLENAIGFMSRQGIFSIPSEYENSATTESEDLIICNLINYERILFLKNLLHPIMDAYIAASQVFKRLVGHEAAEKQLQMDMLAEIKGQVQEKVLKYGESMALDPIRNFISLSLRWQVLESSTKNSVTFYYLHDYFDDQNAVDVVIQRLKKFRV